VAGKIRLRNIVSVVYSGQVHLIQSFIATKELVLQQGIVILDVRTILP
jgi:hypothetical protein